MESDSANQRPLVPAEPRPLTGVAGRRRHRRAARDRRRRRPGRAPLPGILRRHHPQQEHAAGLLPCLRAVLRLVRSAQDRRARRHRAAACRRLYRGARQGFREADGQAAPRRHPHAVRLAGHRPGRRHQSGPCGARSEACRQDRQDHGADRRTGARAAGQHRHLDRGRPARPGADFA